MSIEYIKNNFSRGELSPLMAVRSDTEVYNLGLKQLKNMPVLPYGGCSRRSGTSFVSEVKTSANYTRIIPFIFSETDSQVLEFGNEYVRFYKDGAQVLDGGSPYEITSPFAGTKDRLTRIKYSQKGDVIYFAHGAYRPYKLIRNGLTDWDNVDLFVPAFTSIPAPLNPQRAFGALNAEYIGSELYKITPASVSGDWKENVNDGQGFIASDITEARQLYLQSVDGEFRYYRIVTVTNDEECEVIEVGTRNYTDPLKNLSGGTTLGDDRDLGEIFQESAFGTVSGWPSVITIFQDRLFYGATQAYPQAVWGSQIGQYEDFRVGSNATDAMFLNIDFEHNNPIQWITNGSALYVGTQGEVTGFAGADGVLTPTSFNRLRGAYNGGNSVQPVKVDVGTYFSGKNGARLFSFGYSQEAGGLRTTEQSLLSEHLFKSGILGMDTTQSESSILWSVTHDGGLISITLNTDQQIFAAQSNTFGGADALCDSIAVVPSEDGDRKYQVVKRTIDGSTKRYIEISELNFNADDGKESAWFVDSGLQYNGALTSIITGLDHLEGESVTVYADGGAQNNQTVSGGQITIDTAAEKVTVGLGYGDSTVLELLPLDGINQNGTSLTQTKSINGFMVYVQDTAAFEYSTDGIVWHNPINMQNTVVFDEGQPLVTGWVDMFADSSFQGFNFDDKNARMMFRPVGALPLTILGITVRLGR